MQMEVFQGERCDFCHLRWSIITSSFCFSGIRYGSGKCIEQLIDLMFQCNCLNLDSGIVSNEVANLVGDSWVWLVTDQSSLSAIIKKIYVFSCVLNVHASGCATKIEILGLETPITLLVIHWAFLERHPYSSATQHNTFAFWTWRCCCELNLGFCLQLHC